MAIITSIPFATYNVPKILNYYSKVKKTRIKVLQLLITIKTLGHDQENNVR
jgi:hypothetical protein